MLAKLTSCPRSSVGKLDPLVVGVQGSPVFCVVLIYLGVRSVSGSIYAAAQP